MGKRAFEYKGYRGVVQFDADDGLLHGRVIGLRDVVTFVGQSVAELERSFRESVDFYLSYCDARGEAPERPASGKIMLRIEPELHRELLDAAAVAGKSLNAYLRDLLLRDLHEAA